MAQRLDVRRPRRRASRPASVELPAEVFDVQVNVPLIHQVVVAQLAAARQGTHDDQDPRRGPRWWPQAVQAEGHRSRPPGLDPRAAVHRRWRRARPDAARLRPAHAQEDEGRRPARRPVGPGPQRPRARASAPSSTVRPPRPRPQPASIAAITDRRSVLVVVERDDVIGWKSAAQPRRRAPAGGRPAQHLRRARAATTWCSRPGALDAFLAGPTQGQGRQGRRDLHEAEAEANDSEKESAE